MFSSARRFQATPAYAAFMNVMKTDLKKAMLAKETVKKNTIRSILSTVKNLEIAGASQTEFQLGGVLSGMYKQRMKSAGEFRDQKREDLAEVEEKECEIIQQCFEHLPTTSEEQLRRDVVKFMTKWKEEEGYVPMKEVFQKFTDDYAEKKFGVLGKELRTVVAKGTYNMVWKDTKKKLV